MKLKKKWGSCGSLIEANKIFLLEIISKVGYEGGGGIKRDWGMGNIIYRVQSKFQGENTFSLTKCPCSGLASAICRGLLSLKQYITGENYETHCTEPDSVKTSSNCSTFQRVLSHRQESKI